MRSSETEVLVVGAGPTGLFCAAELARHGVRPRLIDWAAEPSPYSRAFAVHARTLEHFRQAGCVGPFLDAGTRVAAVTAYVNGRRVARMATGGHPDAPYPYPVTLEQSVTERLLTAHLATLGVAAERGIKLVGLEQDADGVTATLRHVDGSDEAVRAKYLAGCDGPHSSTRHLLQKEFEGSAYPLVFALADVRARWPFPADEISVFAHTDGGCFTFPLPGDPPKLRFVLDVTSQVPAPDGPGVHGPAGSRLPPPTLEDIRVHVRRRIGRDVQVSDPTWLSHFRVHIRQVRDYRDGRVLLAGDAAHIHSPAGGQGMNTGLQDAANLAWRLALVARGRATAGLLDGYSPERHAVGQSILALSDRMTRAITLRNPLARLARNAALAVMGRMPAAVHRRVIRKMIQLGLTYRGSPDARDDGPAGRLRAGDRAPDAALARAGGESLTLFDTLQDTRFHLFVTGDAAAAGAFLARWASAGPGDLAAGHWVAPDAAAAAAWAGPGEALVDAAGEFRLRYGASRPASFLVRPDGHLGHVCRPPDAARVAAYLGRLLGRV